MAQGRIAKGTAAAKASGTTLTIPDVSVIGGECLVACVAWDDSVSDGPTVKHGNRSLNFVAGHTINAKWRARQYSNIVNVTKTRDLVVTWPTANLARVVVLSSLHQAGAYNITDDAEHLANTVSTCGPFTAIDHISTLALACHITNGPVGDNIGSSTTGMILGQRIGTSGDDDNTNLTIQEAYKIITASTVDAGSFEVDEVYQIKTIGTTDFTAIGAASNAVGVVFTATGVGTGTGDAYHLEGARSRLTGLTLRDHMGIIGFYRPKQTFTITNIVQVGRNMNQNPYWVKVLVEDESGRGFVMRIDPDHYGAWSDAAILEYVAKFASNWVTNIIDSNLTYVEDTALTDRFSDLINSQVIL